MTVEIMAWRGLNASISTPCDQITPTHIREYNGLKCVDRSPSNGEQASASNAVKVKTLRKITLKYWYRQTSNISRTSVGNKIVDHSDVVGALPVGTAPTTTLFLT